MEPLGVITLLLNLIGMGISAAQGAKQAEAFEEEEKYLKAQTEAEKKERERQRKQSRGEALMRIFKSDQIMGGGTPVEYPDKPKSFNPYPYQVGTGVAGGLSNLTTNIQQMPEYRYRNEPGYSRRVQGPPRPELWDDKYRRY